MNANQYSSSRLRICRLASAVTLCLAGVVQADRVTDQLLYEFSAFDDSDGSNGWQSSVQPQGTTQTMPPMSGAPVHAIQGTAQFFRSSASSQAFGDDFGDRVFDPPDPDHSSWSVDLWLRRQGNPFHVTQEAGIFAVGTTVGNFIQIKNDGVNNTSLLIDHRDRSLNRSTHVNAVDIGNNEWHHIAVTYQDATSGNSDGVMRIYRDGNTTPVAEFTSDNVDNDSVGGSFFNVMSTFAIVQGEANRNFNGDIGLLRFYTDVLTPAEVNQNYNDRATAYLGLAWNVNADGNWSAVENWTGAVPNQAGVIARFDSAISANRTITTDIPITVGELKFNNSNSYVITGTGPLTLDSGGGSAAMNVVSGSHTISVPLVLNSDIAINVVASSTLTIGNSVSAAGKTIAKSGDGLVQFENVRAAGLVVNAGSVKLSQKGTPNAAAGTSKVGALTLAAAASLDLTNNSLVVDYTGASVQDDIRQALGQGRLTSSSAGANTGLGYGEAAVLLGPSGGSFAGQDADADSVLVKFTYKGDATLDGKVNTLDFNLLAGSFGATSGAVWTQGDFNYDGAIDSVDFTTLTTSFGSSGLAGAALGSVVPEPAAMVSLSGIVFLASRRRRVIIQTVA